MAEAYNRKSQEEMNTTSTTPTEVETQDRGMFDLLGRKKEEEEKPAPDKPEVEEEKHLSLLEQMHRSDTPVPVEKKGFLEKMREMLPGQPNKAEDQVVAPPPVKYEAPLAEVPPPQYQDGEGYEKKGIVEKVKEKLPSQHKKAEDQEVAPPPPVKYEAPFAEVPPPHYQDDEGYEKKGIAETMKEKLTGQHKNAEVPPPYYQDDEGCEKKGIAETVKEKLPGQHKNAEVPPPHYQDDEGYEKKGIAETVKEKLPGQHKNAEAPPPHYQDDEGYEKKGIVETVKEKLPGQHNKFEDQVVGPPPVKYEAPFAEVTPPSYQDSVVEEKKGIMEKMKETLPGQHKDAEDRETYAPPPPVKYQAPSGEAPPPSYQDREAEERKGVMEKIKEGLPGQHKNAEDREAYAPPSPMKYEAPSGEAPPPSYQDREAEEKKGIKEKIKEGLPAQHRNAEDREAYAPSPPMKYEAPLAEVSPPLYQDGEKNDILEKMKNLPGQHHKAENQEAYPHPLPPPGAYEALPAEVPPPQCQDGEVEGLIRTPEEKGFLVKMKEKLPGHHKKAEDQALASPPPPSSVAFEAPAAEVPPPMYQDGEAKEKKGIMEKIKEKLPGHHPKSEEDKEKKY